MKWRSRRNIAITITAQALSLIAFRRVVPAKTALFFATNVSGHEVGHFLHAKSYGADVDAPIVISVTTFSAGVTTVRDAQTLSNEEIIDTLLGGLKGGVLTLLAMSPLVLLGYIPITFLGYGLLYELVSATVGSDGSKRRTFRRRQRHLEHAPHNGLPS